MLEINPQNGPCRSLKSGESRLVTVMYLAGVSIRLYGSPVFGSVTGSWSNSIHPAS